MEEQKAIVVSPGTEIRKASEVIDDATDKALALKKVVKKAGLARKFRKDSKEYLEFEAWQTIGQFYGATPIVAWTRRLEKDGVFDGWECRAEVVNAQGQVIGAAEAMCTNTERNWKGRDEYAIRSMAQTRACAKALRTIFAWVAVLAGFAATPAEEMSEEFVSESKESAPQSSPRRKTKAKEAPKKKVQGITAKQKERLYELMREKGLTDQECADFFSYYHPKTYAEAEDFIKHFEDAYTEWKSTQDDPFA